MTTEIEGNIKKEVRRAKRKKNWLADNVLPLSSKELKSLKNKEYRQRLKRKIEEKKDPNYNQNYKKEVLEFVRQQHYTHTGYLNYSYSASMFGAYRDAIRVFESLKDRGVINNYFFNVEYEDQHVHTHFILNTDYPTKINSKIFSVFNGIFDRGQVKMKVLHTENYVKNATDYLCRKLNTDNRSRQSQIDYWSIGL